MLSFPGSLKIYVAIEPQDMRKSFNGLHVVALEKLKEAHARTHPHAK